MKQYSSIEELTLTLALYPNQKESILEEAGKKFKLNGKNAWFAVAEDGNCALFNDRCELDDPSKIEILNKEMISKDIKKINIPDRIRSIGDCAFERCTSLTNINIPGSVTSIGNKAFAICESLMKIIIPNSVTSIGNCAFNGCTALADIIMSDSVESIGNNAFSGCFSLKSITLPSCVSYIGKYAFSYTYELEEITFKGKTIEEVKSMKNYPWEIKAWHAMAASIIKCEP